MSGGIEWFRWHHGSVSDPKFRLVAKRAEATLSEVITVWAVLLEEASAAEDRGSIGRIDCEAIDCMLNLPDGRTNAILLAMEDRGLIDGNAATVTAWSRRQPKREDETANDRKRRQRQREHEAAMAKASVTEDASRNVTQGHAEVTTSHADVTAGHSRGEESRGDIPFETSSAHRAREPEDPKPGDPPEPPPPAPPDPPPKPPPFAPTKAGDVGKALKAAGMDPTQINLADPEVAELIRQGATPEEFGGIAKEALSKKVESPMRWVCVVLRRRREEAAKLALAPKVEKPWHETRSGIEAKGRELGLGTWDEHAAQRGRGEQWTAYQAKVFRAAGVPQERGA